MEEYEVHGIDISHYQNKVNWEALDDERVHFAFMKVTEGESLVDSLFCRNWEAIQNTDIYRGAYHFLRFDCSGKAQAEHFLRYIENDPGDLPPVLDIEVTDGVSKKEMLNIAYEWLETVENATGVEPIIYTNLRFYNTYLSNAFKDHVLWIARYNTIPPVLRGGADWSFWQYGDKGRINGVDGFVDFNVFNGNLQELKELASQNGITYH